MFISLSFLNALNKQCLSYFLVLFGGLICSFNIYSLSIEFMIFFVLITEDVASLFSCNVGDFVERIVLSSKSV